MGKLIAKTYGDALYELAMEENKIDLFSQEVAALSAVMKENEDLTKLINHPKVIKEEKIQVMKNIFQGKISDELLGFVEISIQKDRFPEFQPILDYFIRSVKEYKKIGTAYVATAVELSKNQKKEVENRLLETTSYVQMEMEYSVDKSLIGGMVIRIGDRVVDTSIKNKLNELSKELYNIQLA